MKRKKESNLNTTEKVFLFPFLFFSFLFFSFLFFSFLFFLFFLFFFFFFFFFFSFFFLFSQGLLLLLRDAEKLLSKCHQLTQLLHVLIMTFGHTCKAVQRPKPASANSACGVIVASMEHPTKAELGPVPLSTQKSVVGNHRSIMATGPTPAVVSQTVVEHITLRKQLGTPGPWNPLV